MNPTLNKETFDNIFLHEIVHTYNNDIIWKKDNHGPRFKKSEKFLKFFWNLL